VDDTRRPAAADQLGRHLTGSPSAGTSLAERAADAGARSIQRPAEALRDAEAVLAAAERAGDSEAAAVALRSAGLAARELEDLAAAEAFLRRAISLARRHGLPVREGEARLTLAHVLVLSGSAAAGRREASRATALLEGPARARALAQQALFCQRAGDYGAALEGYRRALAVFRRHGLEADVARLLVNRGITHAYRGELAAARADFEAAARWYDASGQELAAAEVWHDLGWVAALAGDVPAALRRYDEAAAVFRQLGVRRPLGLLDRCEALLAVGLAGDAHAAAAAAVAQLEGEREGTDHAEALLACARAALAAGQAAEARATAVRAEQRFRQQGRAPWAAVAAFVALRAEAAEGGAVTPDRAGALAGELAAAGWGTAALDAHLLAGEAALAAGRPGVAAAHLAAAAAARRSPLAEQRVRGWYAEAQRRRACGRRAGALRALDAGLDVLAANRGALGATELRAGITGHGEALARMGVELAVTSGRPAAVFRWAERSRTATSTPPPRAGEEAEEALAQLRATTEELEEATFAADGRAGALRRRRARLEAAVRAAALRRRAPDGRTPRRPPGTAELRAALGERALVELAVADGTVHAVVLDRRGAVLRRLCPAPVVAREVAHLRFALTRVASDGAAADSDRAAAALRVSTDRVADLVLAPLARRIGDRPLVIVPTGPLHGLPWGVLPPLRGRPVAVAPSAAAWLAADRQSESPAGGRVALIAGPALSGATREVGRLSVLHPGACTLRGRDATVASAATALAGAPLAHVAAHGTFRGDNPRFSSLRLADGPLLVHDLERLAAPPATVVLSACHAAEAVVTAGDEVVGLAGALLALGTGSVVASVAPVPDGPSVDWVVRLHRALADGSPPAEALAATTGALDLGAAAGPAAALAGFVCYGAG
jgi:tetratricopeptide (TPR) repeat protein